MTETLARGGPELDPRLQITPMIARLIEESFIAKG
jgi:hypothetical protein